ncbi:PRC-barrel domain-containing protein [Nafulsella turpanensis]|uniref:PRC-barrel domain-containing protein n=1 Tax=Nafulsella turpanensis TaxID=1265690 RepID=UPI000347700B|nr:PRC-barrel domain-containing protein [Nafulsella turpanensis]
MEDRRDRRTDEVRDTRYTNNDRHLFRLSELDDYKVASDDPDVRGWKVVDRNGLKLGTIEELIVDRDREKVRYLDIAPGRDRVNENDHVLIPIGLARVDENDDKVVINEIDSETIASFPVYKGDVITRDYEHGVMERLNTIGSGETVRRDATTDEFYNNRFYDENQFYEGRNRNL